MDIENEAKIALDICLRNFDLSKYIIDEAVPTSSLEFFFTNYFLGRINFMAGVDKNNRNSRK